MSAGPVLPGGWRVRRLRGAPGELHAEPMPDRPERSVWVLEASRAALVLGSTQAAEVVDRSTADLVGVDVVRRRSGGGAVLVVPGEIAWVDVILPVGDPLWDDDVSRSSRWLGESWRRALGELGCGETTVHRAGMAPGRLGRLVCFGGVGPGEVVRVGGGKVVGISQRRTRAAARFQSAVHRSWDAGTLARLLGLDEATERCLGSAAVGTGLPVDALVGALLDQLPA